MGELLKTVPKATANNNPSGMKKEAQISPHVDLVKPKSQVIKESGITQRQTESDRLPEERDCSEIRRDYFKADESENVRRWWR